MFDNCELDVPGCPCLGCTLELSETVLFEDRVLPYCLVHSESAGMHVLKQNPLVKG